MERNVRSRTNNCCWDTRNIKKYTLHVMYGFSISITWTNERKLNFRWLLYFRSGKVQGKNWTMHIATETILDCRFLNYIKNCKGHHYILRNHNEYCTMCYLKWRQPFVSDLHYLHIIIGSLLEQRHKSDFIKSRTTSTTECI